VIFIRTESIPSDTCKTRNPCTKTAGCCLEQLVGGYDVCNCLRVCCVQKTVADLHFVMDAVFPLVPGEKIQDKRVSLSPAKSRTVGVWTSFSGIPLAERIRDSMEALPRRLESTHVSDDGPRLAARLSPGPSLGLARLHKAL
jgi:hypothetical protein